MIKDGMYFRVCRDGRWIDVCFCDLTLDEIEELTKTRGREWWKSVALYLRDLINDNNEKEAENE